MNCRTLFAAMAALSLTPLAACSDNGSDASNTSADPLLSEAIGSTNDLSKFAEALKKTGLIGIFDGPASYTILAPDDGAFAKLEEADEPLMEADQAAVLAAIVREHILPGAVTPNDIKAAVEASSSKSAIITTMGSDGITFTLEGGRIVATSGDGRRALLSASPIRAANGVVIPVDAVLRETDISQ